MFDWVPLRKLGLTLVFGGMLLVAAIRPAPAAATSVHAPSPQADPALCDAVDAMPVAECAALVALYTATDGANWLDNTNWLQVDGGVTPCNWSGVTCADGHVTGLDLPRNASRGSVPPPWRTWTP
ncbi:MAG: hypothetical protein H6644_10425 [Caldilineaceae bacterium]|nr:hypothetical protein [Caldilineaceae bacterium]